MDFGLSILKLSIKVVTLILSRKRHNSQHALCHCTVNIGGCSLTVLLVVIPYLVFPSCTLLCSVSLLALCNFATCSFSRLFSSSSSSSPAIKKVDSQSNMKYNSPGSLVKRSSTFSQFPTEKSKTFDFLNEE